MFGRIPRISTKIGLEPPNPGGSRPETDRFTPSLSKCGPKLSEFGETRLGVESCLPGLGRIWHEFGHGVARIWSTKGGGAIIRSLGALFEQCGAADSEASLGSPNSRVALRRGSCSSWGMGVLSSCSSAWLAAMRLGRSSVACRGPRGFHRCRLRCLPRCGAAVLARGSGARLDPTSACPCARAPRARSLAKGCLPVAPHVPKLACKAGALVSFTPR